MSNYAPYCKTIDERVQRILKQRQYIKDCHSAEICPKCGSSLAKTSEMRKYHYEYYWKCMKNDCNYKAFISLASCGL